MRFIPKFRVISRKSHVYSRKSFFDPLKWAQWAAVISICWFNFYNFFKIFKFKWKRLATFVFNSIAIYLSICGAPVIGKPNERGRERFNFVLDWVIWWMKKKRIGTWYIDSMSRQSSITTWFVNGRSHDRFTFTEFEIFIKYQRNNSHTIPLMPE